MICRRFCGSGSNSQNARTFIFECFFSDPVIYDNYDDATTSPPPSVVTELMVLTPALFFTRNWLWVLLVILAIVLLFFVPGMILQIYCSKFYRAYR